MSESKINYTSFNDDVKAKEEPELLRAKEISKSSSYPLDDKNSFYIDEIILSPVKIKSKVNEHHSLTESMLKKPRSEIKKRAYE